jgi:hypothetical protein
MESDQAIPNEQPPMGPPTDNGEGAIDAHQADQAPDAAMAANLEGKELASPVQGFGPLWQRRYRIRLAGLNKTPHAVMAVWKEHFAEFQPSDNRFYPSPRGVQPGEVVFVDSSLVDGAGLRNLTEMASGVMVIHVDDLSFTVMTPQGFPVSGWNTFSVRDEEGAVVAQVQGLERTTDPIYEFGYRFLGGEAKQDQTWIHVLNALAAHFGITANVEREAISVDSKIQWRNVGNVRHNAAIRTLLHRLTAPFRRS